MIITRDGEEDVGGGEDGSEEDFEAVAVIGGNLFPGAGPSRILPREGTFFLRMKKGEEGEEEFGSIIFIKDSCNNITDLEEEEKKKNIKNIKNTTEDLDLDQDQGLEEGKRKDILPLHPPAEVLPQILTVLLPRKRKRRRIRSIKRRRRVWPRRRKKRKIPVLAVNLMERKRCQIGGWIC